MPVPVPKIRPRRKSLADQVGRAAESVALDVAEGRARAGLDRADLFRRAAGSAGELTAALRIAAARGYITHADFAAIDAALDNPSRPWRRYGLQNRYVWPASLDEVV